MLRYFSLPSSPPPPPSQSNSRVKRGSKLAASCRVKKNFLSLCARKREGRVKHILNYLQETTPNAQPTFPNPLVLFAGRPPIQHVISQKLATEAAWSAQSTPSSLRKPCVAVVVVHAISSRNVTENQQAAPPTNSNRRNSSATRESIPATRTPSVPETLPLAQSCSHSMVISASLPTSVSPTLRAVTRCAKVLSARALTVSAIQQLVCVFVLLESRIHVDIPIVQVCLHHKILFFFVKKKIRI